MIVACQCESEYQDKRYGKGKRVANPTKGHEEYRCTVCERIHKR